MANGDAGNAALGLRGFARIADKERVDDRQRPGDDFRKAFGGERDRFAGQPFQRAVRAHVDERIGFHHVLQPQPERDQSMARRQTRIVIIGAPFIGAAAIGWQRDPNVAKFPSAETKRAVAKIRIACWLAPRIMKARDRG